MFRTSMLQIIWTYIMYLIETCWTVKLGLQALYKSMQRVGEGILIMMDED